MSKNALRVAAAAIAATMTMASVSPAFAQYRGPTPYYQDRDDRRMSERDHRRLHDRDIYHPYSYMDRGSRQYEREHQRWDRDRSGWGSNRHDERSQYRIDGGTAFAALAGIAIGAAITQNGERRQYYQDRRTNRYYYYNQNDRQYYWDPSYRR